jgi:hypothetical protein
VIVTVIFDFFELAFLIFTFLGLLVLPTVVFPNCTDFGENVSFPRPGVGVAVGVPVAVVVEVEVAVAVGVGVGGGALGVGVRVMVAVAVALAVGVPPVGLAVGVPVALSVGVAVLLAVGVAVAVGVDVPPVGVDVGDGGGVAEAVGVAVTVLVAVAVAVGVPPVAVAVGVEVGLVNGVGHMLPAGLTTVRNALVLLTPDALLKNWNAFGVTGKSVEYVVPVTKISPLGESNASPSPISPIPEPPSRLENFNWLAATACVVSNADTNAVAGTLTPWIEIPALALVVSHAFALCGNPAAPPSADDADVVTPVT